MLLLFTKRTIAQLLYINTSLCIWKTNVIDHTLYQRNYISVYKPISQRTHIRLRYHSNLYQDLFRSILEDPLGTLLLACVAGIERGGNPIEREKGLGCFYYPRVVFLGKTLKPTDSAKDLGVFLDPHLTYDHHISCVVSSCFAKLCQINRVKRSFNKETLELFITSLVFSKMLYCSSVWSNTTLQNINRLQSIQNFASKIVTNSRKFDQY